jgi:hypothetical protein
VVFDTASLVPSARSFFGGFGSVIWYIILGLIILVMLAIVFMLFYFKKRWNLEVEFKLTRSDGRITNAEWGKGYYNSKKGVVFVRRPTMGKFSKGIPIKIFDIRKYLQGDRIITVLQVGPEDFRPVLNDSWTSHVVTYEDDKTGDLIEVKESILNIKVDSGLNKAWKSSWESAAKNAYSIRSFMSQFQTPIAIGIVIICCFVGFAILWTKVN